MVDCDCIRGEHPVVSALRRAALRLAGTPTALVLSGESGSGKAHFARHLHHLTDSESTFRQVDCSLVAGDRMACWLERLCEEPGGVTTLYLDGIESLTTEAEEALLESLRRRETDDTGGRFRLVVAQSGRGSTASEPQTRRLAGAAPIEITFPPLRQRRADIPVLMEYFLERYSQQHAAPRRHLHRAALVALWQYDWPGNVRELASLMERLAVLGRGPLVEPAELPPHISGELLRAHRLPYSPTLLNRHLVQTLRPLG